MPKKIARVRKICTSTFTPIPRRRGMGAEAGVVVGGVSDIGLIRGKE